MGSGPRVFMVGPEDKGIRLTCTGKGGILIVRDTSKTKVSCSMKNPFFGQEQVETISIPGQCCSFGGQDRCEEGIFRNWDGIGLVGNVFNQVLGASVSESFFPRTSPWKVAFAGTFFILGIFLGAVEKKRVQEVQEEKEKESEASESLEKELDWKKANLYAVAVTLDPDSAHPNLIISENRKQVSLMENVPQNCDASVYQGQEESEAVFSVLGQNYFNTGRHYWEVEVNIGTEARPETKWAVGVCLNTVKRDKWFVECPEKNFWVIAYEKGEVKVLTFSESLSLRQHPQRIGVFLDQEDGDVSFYNMVDGSHIFSFTGITSYGTLCPYFRLQGAGTSVTIYSTSDCTENCPDSSPNTSVTHLRSGDMGIAQEA
ncbi:hypothetical protein GH733_000189 [Mirounga leonina]|nr:hypothetical protein GH733_000189 [Mirounga leonina]